MGLSSISGVGRAATSTADTPSPASNAREPNDAPAPPRMDDITHPPVPPRFPWLSVLAARLEPAAKQKPAFASVPLLGDHVDRSA
jgi:hypothetical protein